MLRLVIPPSCRRYFQIVLVLAIGTVFGNSVRGAPSAAENDALTRATLFQAEARAIFEKDKWKIIRTGDLGFTAVHNAEAGDVAAAKDKADPTSPLIVYVAITFTPKNADSTDCAVKVEGFHLIRKPGEPPHLAGPFKADYPENAKYIRHVLETAEDRLGEKHPRYKAQ